LAQRYAGLPAVLNEIVEVIQFQIDEPQKQHTFENGRNE